MHVLVLDGAVDADASPTIQYRRHVIVNNASDSTVGTLGYDQDLSRECYYSFTKAANFVSLSSTQPFSWMLKPPRDSPFQAMKIAAR